jgi:hypothetical protein
VNTISRTEVDNQLARLAQLEEELGYAQHLIQAGLSPSVQAEGYARKQAAEAAIALLDAQLTKAMAEWRAANPAPPSPKFSRAQTLRGIAAAAAGILILTACSSDPTGPVTSLTPTDLDAGDTTSTDLGTVAETGTTNAGDTTPEVVQPDTRTDTEPEPDSGRDSEEDAEVVQPDTTPIIDQCTGPFDTDALTDRTALQSSMWACLVDCGRDVPAGEVEACTVACIDRGTELTPGCAGCFGELATCALDAGCFEVCEGEPDGWRCAYCQWTSCREGFEGCAGAGMWRTEEACEEAEDWGYEVRDALYCYREESERLDECLANVEPKPARYTDAPECLECSALWSESLPAECPACISDAAGRECSRCVNASEALRAVTFCGGTGVRRP